MVTRLTKQKGLDLVRTVFREIMEEDVQCIILGSGDSNMNNSSSGWHMSILRR